MSALKVTVFLSTQATSGKCGLCDSLGIEWVRPCKCDGSVGYVHQDCVKRWVEEKQKSDINLDGLLVDITFLFAKLVTS